MKINMLLATAVLIGLTPLAAAHADAPIAHRATTAESAAFAADRLAILAMAGNFHVTFDMHETTTWRKDYTPIPAKVAGGDECVRVIADDSHHIVLQHLLVTKDKAGKTEVVKHWRQDWTYEPDSVLVYAGDAQWKTEAVPVAMRQGRWSQTVWQTDDSPRYGGWGQWTDEGGIRRWRSNWTSRPLARRDAVRHPPYDRYLGINRHSPTPDGWIHWQDNIKMGKVDGKVVPFVQESVLNTYKRGEDFEIAAADAYWAATKDYWAAVRGLWDAAIVQRGGVHVAEVAATGSASGESLMGYADDIQAGKLKTPDAIAKAAAVIGEATRT